MKRTLILILTALMLLAQLPASGAEAVPDGFAGAQWIWTDTWENNEWVYLQKTFSLESVPETAQACIAAADKYTLYVNGELAVLDGSLKRGENPTDGWYDRVELAPYLRNGENIIAVKAWFWGRREAEESTSHAFTSQAGFLMVLDAGDQRIATDSTWKAYREAAYLTDKKNNPAPRSCLPEYNVCYDAGAGISDSWLREPAAGWESATVRAAAGDPIYGALTERPIPMFAFGGLTDFVDGPQWFGHRTERKEDITLTLPRNEQFTFYLKVSASRSRTITIQTNNYKQSKLGHKYLTSGDGEQTFEFPAWLNGDSVTLSIPGGVTILDLKYRPTWYDTRIGRFSMDDAFYDTLWQMGVQTQLVCMRDTFMDCPDRERAQWWGDATNQMEQTLYAMDEQAWLLYEKGLRQKLGWMHDGAFQTIVPSEENSELPIQELAGIVGIWQYYLYTGRQYVPEEMFDACLNYLLKWEMTPQGLVSIRKCNWAEDYWYDAYTGHDRQVLENAWYYWAAASVQKMAAVLGRDAVALKERTDAIAAAFDAAFWTEQGYLSADTAAPDDRAQAIAVLSGLADESRYPVLLSTLRSVMQCGTFMEKYVLEAMCEMGCTGDALDRMKTRYSPMVAFNEEHHITTLWEYWERESGTENHAWSAGPVFILSKYVGGIRPLEPGFTSCLIAPDFSRSETVSVSLATVKGTIEVSGSAKALTVTLPEGVSAQVILSGTAAQVLSGAGTYTITAD